MHSPTRAIGSDLLESSNPIKAILIDLDPVTPTPKTVLFHLLRNSYRLRRIQSNSLVSSATNQATMTEFTQVLNKLKAIIDRAEEDACVVSCINQCSTLLETEVAIALKLFLECYPFYISKVDTAIIQKLQPLPYGIDLTGAIFPDLSESDVVYSLPSRSHETLTTLYAQYQTQAPGAGEARLAVELLAQLNQEIKNLRAMFEAYNYESAPGTAKTFFGWIGSILNVLAYIIQRNPEALEVDTASVKVIIENIVSFDPEKLLHLQNGDSNFLNKYGVYLYLKANDGDTVHSALQKTLKQLSHNFSQPIAQAEVDRNKIPTMSS
jgi:hypothetical protein